MPDQVDPKEMARRVMAARAEIRDPRQTLGAWGDAVGKRIAQALPTPSKETQARGRGVVEKVASFMRGDGRDNPPVAIVQEYDRHAYPHAQQDAELEANRQRIEALKAQQPTDIGDIDDQPRDITSFHRSDAKDQPVNTYTQEDIDRVKRAIAAAQK